MDVFDLAAKISLDTSVYKQSLKDAADDTESFGSKMGSAFQTLATVATTALATVSGAVIGIGTASLKQYADFEQLVGGVDTLFKESSGKIQAYADQAYKTAGVSANQYMETVTSFSASLLQSLNWNTEKAAEYANQALIDMSDNANKMGTDMSMIQNAYQGFAKQNYTMLDNLKLGYGGTKTEMERLIADANTVKEANGEMADLSVNSFADIVEAIHIIQTEMGITGTTAKEASETISGSVSSAKAAWENWLTGLADSNADMEGRTDELVFSVKTAANNIIPRAQEILGSLVDVFGYMTGIDTEAIGEKFSDIRDKISEFRAAVGEKLSELKVNFSEFAGDVKISFGLDGFTGVLDLITDKLSNIVGFDVSIITGKFKIITDAIDGLRNEGASGLFGSFGESIEKFLGFDTLKLEEKFEDIGQKIDDFVIDIGQIGLLEALDKHLLTPFEEFTGLDIKGMFEDIATKVGDLARAFKEGGLAGFFEELGASQEAIDTFKISFGEFGESLEELFPSLLELVGLVGGLAVKLTELISDETFDSFLDAAIYVVSNIMSLFAWLFDFISNGIDIVTGYFKEDFEKVGEAISELYNKVLPFLLDIIDWVVSVRRYLGLLTEDEIAAAKYYRDQLLNAANWGKEAAGSPPPNYSTDLTPSQPLQPDVGAGNAPMDPLKPVIPTDYVEWQNSAAGISSQAQIESMLNALGLSYLGDSGEVVININIDGENAASVLYDPLRKIANQKGEAVNK